MSTMTKIRKLTGMVLAFAIMLGALGSALVKPAEACRVAHWGGNVPYISTALAFNIQNSALVGVFGNMIVYQSIRNSVDSTVYAGWNDISSNVNIIQIANNVHGAGNIQVRGEPLGFPFMGVTLPRNGNNIAEIWQNWTSVEIVMNNDLGDWNLFAPNIAERLVLFRKVFAHEVGHVLKLSHPLTDAMCTNFALMQQGVPRMLPNGQWEVSHEVAAHDFFNVRERWGA
jgi:hypothetical protein